MIVSVLADTKHFRSGLGSAASALGDLGSKLGTTAAVGVGALAGLGAGVVGLAAKKGISRALGIEDATAKLKALGMQGEQIQQTMNDALASVKGTSFGLDAAATVAGTAVAAQIKPGKDLQRYLGLVADTAQVAGTSMEDMGAIFGKVANNQKVTTEEMNQLADRGIPIWKYLSESMGVSNDELRQMVSDGKVSLEDFQSAIEKNISGAGRIMADTTSGAFKNMNAALGRLGAAFAAPALTHAKTLFQEASIGIDGVTTALKPAAEKLEATFGPKIEGLLQGSGQRFADFTTGLPAKLAPVTSAVGGAFESAKPYVSRAVDGIGTAFAGLKGKVSSVFESMGGGEGILTALGGVKDKIISVVEPIAQAVAPVVGQLISAFAPLLPQIGALIPTVMQLSSVFNPVSLIFHALMPVLPQIVTLVGQMGVALAAVLGQVLPQIAPALEGLAGLLSGLFAQVAPVISGLLTQIGGIVVGTLIPAIGQLMPILTTVIQAVVGMLAPMLPMIGNLLGAVATVIGSILNALAPLVPVIISIIGTVVSALAPLLPQIGMLLAAVGDAIAALLVALSPLITVIGQMLGPLLSVIMAALTPIIDIVVMIASVLASVLTVAIQAIVPIIASVIEIMTSGMALVMSVVGPAITWIAQLITSCFQAIYSVTMSVWNSLVAVISGAINATIGAISGWVSSAMAYVRSLGSGISSTISGAMGSMTSAISGGVNTAVSWISSLPGKAKSALGNLGNTLWNAGKSLIDGFVSGIKSAFGSVQSALGGLTNMLPSWKGPEDIDKILLVPAGRMVIGGFVRGLESQYPRVRASLTGLTRDIAGMDMLSPASDLALAGGPTIVHQYTINVTADMLTPSVEAGRTIADALDQYMRMNGADR